MNRHRIIAICFMVLSLVGYALPDSPPAGDTGDSLLWVELVNYYTPEKIYSLTDTGKFYYRLDIDSTISGTDLTGALSGTDSINPYLTIEIVANGKKRIVEERYNNATLPAILAGDSCYIAKKYAAAIEHYEKAAVLQPLIAQTYVFIGNARSAMGANDLALKAFQSATQKSPVDYHAFYFLALTYFQMQRLTEAETAIATALMLNKNNSTIVALAREIAAKNGKRFRTDRFLIPLTYTSIGADSLAIIMYSTAALPWIHYFGCLLVWQFEPEMLRFREVDDALRQTRNKHCLINLTATLPAMIKRKEDLTEQQRYILLALANGYRDAIVYWEFGASAVPFTTLLLPDDIKRIIVEYIQKFVFVKSENDRKNRAP
jgi:tetratricopeptide (TPR) repeat protein